MSSSASPQREFLYGWTAGCVETVALYPSYKVEKAILRNEDIPDNDQVIFRQTLHGVAARTAYEQIRSEGLGFLYRGLLPPLLMRTSTRALMFGGYDGYRRLLGCDDESGRATSRLCVAQAAFLAGSTEGALCPFERIQVLLQTSKYHDRMRNTRDALRIVWQEYGLREFYRGFTLIALRNGTSNALFFLLRDPFRSAVFRLAKTDENHDSVSVNMLADFFSGAVLGASLSTLSFPLNVLKNRQQSRLGGDFESARVVFAKVRSERGGSVRALFRGVHLNFTRSLLSWGIINTTYGLLRREFG